MHGTRKKQVVQSDYSIALLSGFFAVMLDHMFVVIFMGKARREFSSPVYSLVLLSRFLAGMSDHVYAEYVVGSSCL